MISRTGVMMNLAECHNNNFTRREFLYGAALGTGALLANRSLMAAPKPTKRPKVAAIFTELRFRSHAYNILENFMGPYLFNGRLTDPGVDVVSFYADQFPDDDMAREVSKRFGIPLCKSIDEAMCVGGKELAVDAVLSIGEHGEYPYNKLGQKMYPRKRFFNEIVAPMKRANRFVPVFNDKHLSYRWDWAKEIYDTAKEHGIPFMAGSSVPLAQRLPAIDMPAGAEIEEAVAIHGGGFESYDFHGLELLQSFVESRNGGESGVAKVELLSGEKLQRALKSGRIPVKLADVAMQAETDGKMKRRAYPTSGQAKRPASQTKPKPKLKRPSGPHALVVTYADGFQGTVMTVGSSANRWNFACKIRGETKPRATALFNGPWGNRCLFKALSHSIQHLFRTGKEPYPAERTLLVTGILDAAVRSFSENRSIETPHLDIAYRPIDFKPMRENGNSWSVITIDTPQPIEFAPGADTGFLNNKVQS